ncbi:MAG TPA: hypothetical protein VGL28_06100 [Steroidobacteraceae bacterium]|jgi:hypothetical protein
MAAAPPLLLPLPLPLLELPLLELLLLELLLPLELPPLLLLVLLPLAPLGWSLEHPGRAVTATARMTIAIMAPAGG